MAIRISFEEGKGLRRKNGPKARKIGECGDKKSKTMKTAVKENDTTRDIEMQKDRSQRNI
jgi:hypothetical protein